MRTEFPPPQAANIMPRLRQAAPTTMLGWLHATFYHATTTQSQRYAVEGDRFVPKSHEFGPTIARPRNFALPQASLCSAMFDDTAAAECSIMINV